jgi:hypothetical protein
VIGVREVMVAGVTHGTSGVVGTTWGAIEVVGTTQGTVEVKHVANKLHSAWQLDRQPLFCVQLDCSVHGVV